MEAVAGNGNSSSTLVSSGICGNHGKCIPQPGGSIQCQCNAGYTGDRCHQSKYCTVVVVWQHLAV